VSSRALVAMIQMVLEQSTAWRLRRSVYLPENGSEIFSLSPAYG
jgi:hypothetical protein